MPCYLYTHFLHLQLMFHFTYIYTLHKFAHVPVIQRHSGGSSEHPQSLFALMANYGTTSWEKTDGWRIFFYTAISADAPPCCVRRVAVVTAVLPSDGGSP